MRNENYCKSLVKDKIFIFIFIVKIFKLHRINIQFSIRKNDLSANGFFFFFLSFVILHLIGNN